MSKSGREGGRHRRKSSLRQIAKNDSPFMVKKQKNDKPGNGKTLDLELDPDPQ